MTIKKTLFFAGLTLALFFLVLPPPTQAKGLVNLTNNRFNPLKYLGHSFNLVGRVQAVNAEQQELTIATTLKSHKIKEWPAVITLRVKPEAKIILHNKKIPLSSVPVGGKAFVWGKITASQLEADKMIINDPPASQAKVNRLPTTINSTSTPQTVLPPPPAKAPIINFLKSLFSPKK